MSVEKYILKKDESGFTILPNHVLQNLKDMQALGLWAYLASKPQDWRFYKQELQKHFNVGRDRLEKTLKILKECGLISISCLRAENGQFQCVQLHVHNGSNFKETCNAYEEETLKNNYLCESVQPFTEKPLTDNHAPVNDHYKERITKKENTKKITTSYSATKPVAQKNDEAFENFWEMYPVKKNKVRAKKIWDREKLQEIAPLICQDVCMRREKDAQWEDKQYIPHASTYLLNALWEDEITYKLQKTKKVDAFTAFLQNSSHSGETYDQYGNAIYPLC